MGTDNTNHDAVWHVISAGTWEEKNLNKWATERIKAFQVTVRNKKRVGYTYEITVKVKGEWLIGEEKKTFKGNLDLAEFSFGELDDLQIEARLTDDKDLLHQDKQRIRQDMKMFLKPIREKLLEFEAELKERFMGFGETQD
uniref:Activator of Hsp90 ATPase, N-terminal n=1 Tax=Tanacetum cinerariifolium TaxID=118510 RepID=A0A699IDH1_TANCI|nr:activator of Hsp90 ATPase, N-terminal [Tanacetum cinerariifolium]